MSLNLKSGILLRILENTKFGGLNSKETFRYNEPDSRFELQIGKELCTLEVLHTVDKMYLVHLSVPDNLQRKEYSRRLVANSLSWIREHKLRIVPLCPYVAKYINKNPKFKFILASRFVF